MINRFYIKFSKDTTDFNYKLYFKLMLIAEFDKENKTFSIIKYDSIKELSVRLLTSESTLKRFLKSEYDNQNRFIQYDKNKKEIYLLNDIRKNKNIQFVILTNREIEILLNYSNELIIYYLYIKHYCGNGNNDFTAKQFLLFINKSIQNGNNYTLLSNYNKILVQNQLIKIETYRDYNKKIRNIYSLL